MCLGCALPSLSLTEPTKSRVSCCDTVQPASGSTFVRHRLSDAAACRPIEAMPEGQPTGEKLRLRIRPVLELLERHRLVDALLERQTGPRKDLVESLVHRQQLSELGKKLDSLHSADIAHLLEMLPPDDRALLWGQVSVGRGGDVLWEISDGIAEALMRATPRDRLLPMLRETDPDGLRQIAPLLPADVLVEVLESIEPADRRRLSSSITYPEGSVGHLMTEEVMVVEEGATVKSALKAIRRRAELPHQTDKLFVVDSRRRLKGSLSLTTLLIHRPRQEVVPIMDAEVLSFHAVDKARDAAQAFDRYDLVSAPVVDEAGRLVGRLTVDAVMDFVRTQADEEALKREGLRPNEDLFAPVWSSARRRWLWLSINLFTAVLASRVIGMFEGAIEQLVALATLMPIVASIGGNTGNQTVALLIRGMALNQLHSGNLRYLALKELGVGLVNGALWGAVMGLVAFGLYHNTGLGLVMAMATLLNLLVAALAGIAVPLAMERLGRDPALGSSVLLTFTTDSMGFFIFLGLAAAFLYP